MSPTFQGIANIDIRDSTPDWGPYEQPKAPEGAPNVIYLVLDDVGFGAMSVFGGLIDTPNLQRLADNGLRYAQFHTTALCSPTRASMLTGRNHTTVGMACIAEATTGFPGSNGHIPFETATIAEVLADAGYNTYMTGKWHCCPEDEMNMASSKRNWPTGRGFERYYGFLGGETNQWYPDLVQDQQFVEQPYGPEDGYHLSKDLTDRTIAMIADAKQVAPDKPFFMYYSFGCGHAPHHAPKEWIDRYAGRFDDGYEAYREVVFANQKRLGLIPDDAVLTEINPYADATSADGTPWAPLDIMRPWDDLSADEQRLFARMAEVYAGFVSYTDDQIGRMLDYLESIGELDNTLIMAISDNGASGEGGPNGSVNENKFFNNVPDDLAENLSKIDELGGPGTYNHYPNGWAVAFCTPFKMYKRYAWNGGICDPLIVHWPAGIDAKGEVRDQYVHVSDMVPTTLECIGVDLPDVVKGYTQWPLEGRSFRSTFDDAAAPEIKETQYYTMLGSRGIYHKGWKANTVHPTITGWGDYTNDRWELFDVRADRTESNDLSARHPEKLEELKSLWYVEAGKYFGLPIDDRSALEVLTTPRPQMVAPRDRYIYYPDTLEVPEAVAANIRGRSYNLTAEVHLTAEAEGVVFAHGHKFGGHALYIKDGRLTYVYNFLGMDEQVMRSDAPLPQGDCVLGVEFVKDRLISIGGSSAPNQTIGRAALHVDGDVVAELAEMRAQVGKFALTGEGLNVGRDGSAPVSDDYPGTMPWRFTGGTIRRVIVDVSGDPYQDLEKDADAMMKRE